jgi:hypothetical protein
MQGVRPILRLSLWLTSFAALLGLLAPAVLTLAAAAEQEDPKDIVATQIRGQGYACDNPQSAVRDQALSKPDEAVWLLKCENATYRVRLIPSMAARVERID